MAVVLRVRGSVYAEFELVGGPFDKTFDLMMKRPGERARSLLTVTVVDDKLLYSTAGNVPVLGGDGKEVEIASTTSTTPVDE